MTWDAPYSEDELVYRAWESGTLRWVLRPHQHACYDAYREWEKRDPMRSTVGMFPRLFGLDISKRWGKTSSRVLVRFEDCLRRPNSSFRYSTAFQKDIEEIIDDVAQAILESCPREFRPEYKGATGARGAGFYFPHNGSVLKLAGLDKNPNALRGRASDGDDLSEAAFISHLRYTVKNVLYHQYQGRPHARMCIESSAPVEPDTEYDTLFIADCKARQAYYRASIDDNTHLSHEEREEFIKAAGGRDHPDCRREYFCERVRPEDTTVLPEFDKRVHVVARRESPAHAHCYVSADPAIQDMFALLWGYWDAPRQKLVIQRSWAKRNAGTAEVAEVVRKVEAELWSGTQYYDTEARALKPEPHMRVSDVDTRLIYDLANEHKLQFAPSRKDDADAQLYALRNAFRSGLIEIEDGGGPLADQCEAARWNTQRTDFMRTELYGHYDCVDALIYLWRLVSGLRNLNPEPPVVRAENWFERPKHEPTIAERLAPDWRKR